MLAVVDDKTLFVLLDKRCNQTYGPVMTIPQQSIDFIVNEETGGAGYYSAVACHPVWPGGISGITIGVGYDLGENSLQAFQQAWGAVLPASDIAALTPAIGIKGGSASVEAQLQQLVHQLSGISIPWAAANSVFATSTLPHYEAMTLSTFPGLSGLNGLCIGAMVSLVYNRGTSLVGSSRSEMATIHNLIQAGTPAGVPDQFRAMVRLWPTVPDLQKRRQAEADMFQQGLDAMGIA